MVRAPARVVVATIDTSNPAAPTVTGRTTIPTRVRRMAITDTAGAGSGTTDILTTRTGAATTGTVIGAGDSFVQVGNKLAYLEVLSGLGRFEGNPYDSSNRRTTTAIITTSTRASCIVVDLTNPASLIHEKPIQLPESRGTTPLHVMNGQVLTSRWTPSPANKNKVRFYVDRVDLNGATTALASVNVPGSLLQVDASSSRIVTTDYHVNRTAATDWNDCYYKNGYRGLVRLRGERVRGRESRLQARGRGWEQGHAPPDLHAAVAGDRRSPARR